MDRRQNNGSVKSVSPRHCPATCALHNCCFNYCAWAESQRQCTLHCCWWTTWTTRSERSQIFAAQLHLPTHDLFWAILKVQLHLPPLRSVDLLISPGTLQVMIIVVISIVLYLTGKGEPTVLYKINNNVYIKTSKIINYIGIILCTPPPPTMHIHKCMHTHTHMQAHTHASTHTHHVP